MIINRASIEAVTRTIRTAFQGALEQTPTMWEQLAMRVPSSNKREDYTWFAELPVMKEWLDERQLANLRAHTYSIKNRTFENSIRVFREEIEDDQTGQAALRARALGEMAALHKDQLLIDLIASGFTDTAYDGEFFFDTDHGDSGDKSNKGTAALSVSAYESAFQAMEEITDDNGEPLNVRPNLLLCGPKNRKTATELLQQKFLSSGEENIHYQEVDLMISQRLVGAYDDYWFLLKTDGVVKPFVMQERRPMSFTAKDNLDDDNVFYRNEFHYGADYRGNAGFGLWQLAWGSDGTT